jgi:hypothetical protein
MNSADEKGVTIVESNISILGGQDFVEALAPRAAAIPHDIPSKYPVFVFSVR